jgi:uncharacterized membrane protein YfcA
MSLGIWGAMPLATLGLLFMVAGLAGCIDAIAGGGGLISVPSLLWAGLTPAQTLATNKVQSSFGTGSATWHFYRAGALDLPGMRWAIVMVFAAALSGTIVVQHIDPAFLRRILPFMLLGIAAYFLFKPSIGEADRRQRVPFMIFAALVAPLIGFYDGFFGPGAGSFFAIAMVDLLGYNLTKATAHTKLLNLTSNLAAVTGFLLGGQIVWVVAMVMAAGQFIGAKLGSHLVLSKGAKLVRPLLVTVSLALTVKLVTDDPQNGAYKMARALWDFIAS